MSIPYEHLPPGFAQSLDVPPVTPATPLPAATVVLVRDGAEGPEVLLLRRHRNSGFVPGAYVFPGGRVDRADADDRLAFLVAHPPLDPPLMYWLAAVREAFEETGVLLACTADGRYARDAHADPVLGEWREALLEDHATLLDVLSDRDLRPDLSGMTYGAHWVTPVVEPRRYDTRFFVAALPPGQEAHPDEREMSDALWLAPAVALARFREGNLPMVFPTVRTLEDLDGHASVAALLAGFGERRVACILPRLVRGETGVELVVEYLEES